MRLLKQHWLKVYVTAVAVLIAGALRVMAQGPGTSIGGVSDAFRDYVMQGSWTFRGANPITIAKLGSNQGTVLTTAASATARTFTFPDATDTAVGAASTTNMSWPEGVCSSGAASADILCANAADHLLAFNPNNPGLQNLSTTAYLTGSAYTNASTAFSNVTGLSFPVSASRNYHADCVIIWQGSAGTTGAKYQFTGPGSPTAVAARAIQTVTATTSITSAVTAFSTPMPNTGTITTATNFSDDVSLAVLNGTTAGTVQLQAAANGTGTLTIQPGSYCTVQ